MKPQRIQRRRMRGWKMPENTVYVGRPSIYGNEFDHTKLGRAAAVESYRVWLSAHMEAGTYMAKLVANLKGKHLACWCRLDEPCHADILLTKANEELPL